VPLPAFIRQDVPLAPYTTLRIGGPALYFASITTPDELLEAIAFARTHSLQIFVLGGGSNLLVTDDGFPGLVLHIHIEAWASVDYIGVPPEPPLIPITVVAGGEWDEFVLSICQLNLSGVECLAGIPGLVGGSPIQNIGAYGQEVAQVIHSVTALDLESMSFVTLPHSDCGFAYRTSIFNTTHRNRYVIVGVTFRFNPLARPTLTYSDLEHHFVDNPNPTPLEVYHAVREIRRAKGMLIDPEEDNPDTRSAGSFFKNPIVPRSALTRIGQSLGLDEADIPNWPAGEGIVKLPAAWLLERAGFHKGFVMGAAGISSRHTLALINHTGTATFADIAALRDTIVHEIRDRFGIALEQEPVQVG
jgi:UDP-N-acetylmuramate dehydrogenase